MIEMTRNLTNCSVAMGFWLSNVQYLFSMKLLTTAMQKPAALAINLLIFTLSFNSQVVPKSKPIPVIPTSANLSSWLEKK